MHQDAEDLLKLLVDPFDIRLLSRSPRGAEAVSDTISG